MDSTTWERMTMTRMRVTMMKGIIKEEDPVENGPQELDDLDDLGDLDEDPNERRSDVDEWFPQDGSNNRD
jgi:hypothetical protein